MYTHGILRALSASERDSSPPKVNYSAPINANSITDRDVPGNDNAARNKVNQSHPLISGDARNGLSVTQRGGVGGYQNACIS